MVLSSEQKKKIEDSLWGVNTVLKRLGLSGDEDLRQGGILYMCKCLERYNPETGVKWTTYAYKSVYLYIKRMNRRKKKLSEREVYDEVIILTQEDKTEQAISAEESKIVLRQIGGLCTDEERRVLALKLQGYNSSEIGRKIGCSQSKVSSHIRSIKTKARFLRLNV